MKLAKPCEALWNPCGIFVELCGTRLNLPMNLPRMWWNPGGTLMEPYLKPPRTTSSWWVEPSWNLTSNHPGPPRSPCRTWWNLSGTLVEPWWWSHAALADRGTLVEPYFRAAKTTQEPIWAETPKLSAVGKSRRF